jgi:hypothetical protein
VQSLACDHSGNLSALLELFVIRKHTAMEMSDYLFPISLRALCSIPLAFPQI